MTHRIFNASIIHRIVPHDSPLADLAAECERRRQELSELYPGLYGSAPGRVTATEMLQQRVTEHLSRAVDAILSGPPPFFSHIHVQVPPRTRGVSVDVPHIAGSSAWDPFRLFPMSKPCAGCGERIVMPYPTREDLAFSGEESTVCSLSCAIQVLNQ